LFPREHLNIHQHTTTNIQYKQYSFMNFLYDWRCFSIYPSIVCKAVLVVISIYKNMFIVVNVSFSLCKFIFFTRSVYLCFYLFCLEHTCLCIVMTADLSNIFSMYEFLSINVCVCVYVSLCDCQSICLCILLHIYCECLLCPYACLYLLYCVGLWLFLSAWLGLYLPFSEYVWL